MVLLGACAHSDPFTTSSTGNGNTGPFADGPVVQLTFNPDQDYWPMWTQDGAGVLYSYVPPGRSNLGRCLGILPAGGGVRIWSLCDDRVTMIDSTRSFAAFSLDSSGRLLYLEVVGTLRGGSPSGTVLWLADTTAPFQRRAIGSFPRPIGDSVIDWLADIRWTGQNEFVALGLRFGLFPHGAVLDTVFLGRGVIKGTIGNGEAILTLVKGTESAVSYALANQGRTIVFGTNGQPLVPTPPPPLQSVPVEGGVPVVIAARPGLGIQGVSCADTVCVAASDGQLLWRVSLNSGALEMVASNLSGLYTPMVRPGSSDVVVQSGGSVGHLGLTEVAPQF